MNQHGETFEDRPPPGEYRVCPLDDCRYKLYVGPDLSATVNARPWPLVPLGDLTVQAMVLGASMEEARRQDELIRAHLKTHAVLDFYRTRARVMEEAHQRVAVLMQLADMVFAATATQETTEEGK